MEVVPTRDLEPAGWLVEAITDFGGRVAQLMPAGYDSVVRIFHRPDQGVPDVESARSWAEVAARHGTTLHPEAQWIALTGGGLDSHSGPTAPADRPLSGSLDRFVLARLCEGLAEHTTTPELCHFALYEGLGKSPIAWDKYPRFALPGRRHWLFAPVPVRTMPACAVELEVAGIEEQSRQPGGIRGLVVLGRTKVPEDSTNWVRWHRDEGFVQSPSWWWPEDRAWVVRSEIDYDSTLVACSNDAADALLDHPDIECLRVTPSTSLMDDADQINHLR